MMDRYHMTSRDHVWYVKYISAVVILIAMVFHVNGWTPWNSYIQVVGALGWIYVGYKWDERSLILNFLPQLFIIFAALFLYK
jgi:hypothetical protein